MYVQFILFFIQNFNLSSFYTHVSKTLLYTLFVKEKTQVTFDINFSLATSADVCFRVDEVQILFSSFCEKQHSFRISGGTMQ